MVDKERILDALDDFKDEYGTSFSSAYAEETDIIEDALNLYYEMLKEEKKKRKEDAISREFSDPRLKSWDCRQNCNPC